MRSSRTRGGQESQLATTINSSSADVASRRTAETAEIKRALTGKPITEPVPLGTKSKEPAAVSAQLTWDELEKRERIAIIERQRKARK